MKGIIAEIHGRYMIVITKNGDFIKCKKLPNCDIGDEVNIPVKNIQSIYKKISTIAASFVILAMLSSGVYAYYTPYSYVSIDINPSLELYINRFDKVIGVHAFNEDAKKIIAASEGIKNKNVDAALEQLLDSATEAGYLKQNAQNSVMLVVSSNNKEEEIALSDKVSKTSTTVLSDISSNYDVILEKTKVENYKKAKEQNISPGKVILANQFKVAKPEINEEEIKHMPLQQAIKEIEKRDNSDNKDNKDNKDNRDNKQEGIKPKTATEKPKSNDAVKHNVMNVRELIREKNEELGERLEKENNNSKNKKDEKKDKDKEAKDNDSEKKDDDRESFKQIDKENNKEKDNYQQEKGGQDNGPSKDRDDKNDREDRNEKSDDRNKK